MRNLLYLVSLSIIISSCNLITNENNQSGSIATKNKKSESEVTIRKYYFEDGKTLKKEITVKNGKKNGPAKEYYVTGELRTSVYYVDSKKHGETIWYYRNGQPYRVTPYINGKMDGIRKTYYDNGKLQAEIPYKNGKLLEGTKEFNTKGELIQHQVEIVIRNRNHLKINNKYVINTFLSEDKYSKIKYFKEGLNTEGKISRVEMESYKGVGMVEYFIGKGTSKSKNIKFLAEFKTNLGNSILISKDYKLNVSNN